MYKLIAGLLIALCLIAPAAVQAEPAMLAPETIAAVIKNKDESALVKELESYCKTGCVVFNEADWAELQLVIAAKIKTEAIKKKNSI
jgi:hypothetical protein